MMVAMKYSLTDAFIKEQFIRYGGVLAKDLSLSVDFRNESDREYLWDQIGLDKTLAEGYSLPDVMEALHLGVTAEWDHIPTAEELIGAWKAGMVA